MAVARDLPCTSCGGPRNHYINSVQQKLCAACGDHKARLHDALKPRRVVDRPLSTDAIALIKQIDDLLMDGYGWAAETLGGIRETVLKTGHATERQYTAVTNIEESKREKEMPRR